MSRSFLPFGAAAFAGVVVWLAGCGGGGVQPCAVYQHNSQAYLVVHPAGGTDAAARHDCARLASAWSRVSVGGGRPSVVNAKSDYAGYLLICSAHGGLGELDLYAKHRSASTQDLCTVLNGSFGRRTTEVLRLTRPSQSPVYFVLSGPLISVKVIEQHFSSLSSKKSWRFAVVPKPAGQKACTSHRPPVTVAIYSPSKNAAASICHSFG